MFIYKFWPGSGYTATIHGSGLKLVLCECVCVCVYVHATYKNIICDVF